MFPAPERRPEREFLRNGPPTGRRREAGGGRQRARLSSCGYHTTPPEVRQAEMKPGLSRFFPWRTPRLGAKSPETLGEKVSGGCRGEGETFPWRPPRPLLGARGERVAPESCRAGHLRASSPSRSAVRHGLVGARLAPPRNWPRAAASRRFPPFPARPGPMPPGRRVARRGPSVPSRLRGLRAHRFRAWGAGCVACRRGCALADLRSRLRRPHPASPSIGICPLRPWPSGTAAPPLAPSAAYRGAWRKPSAYLLPELPRSGAGRPGRRRLRRLRRAGRGRARRAAQARRAFGRMHGRAGAERAAGRRPMRRRAVPAPPETPDEPSRRRPTDGGPAGRRLGARNTEARGLPRGRRPSTTGCRATPTAGAGKTGVCPRPRRPAMRPFGAVLPPPCSAPRTGPQRRAARGLSGPIRPFPGVDEPRIDR